jgi:hypothetical protein
MALTKVDAQLLNGAVTVDSSGNVGIGVTNPVNKLALPNATYMAWKNSSGSETLAITGTSDNALMFLNGSERMRIYANGNVGVTNNLDFVGGAATVRIHMAGGSPTSSNTGIAAAWNVHSDYRLKENVTPLVSALDKVSALRPVSFTWIEDDVPTPTAGFIAHELAEQAPYAVLGEKDAVNEDGSIKAQAADYSKVVPLLTAAIQELKAELDATKAEVAALKAGA